MSTKLQRHKLSSLIDVKRGQSISGEYYASEGEHVRLTLANFDYVNGGFKVDTQKDDLFYTGPVKPECLLKKDDIITPLTEQALGLLGSTARIPESDKYVQSGDIALVTCKEGLIDPDFCYYLLPSKQVKKQLAAGSQQTKIRHTSPDAIKACVVDIPDFEQQKKIGKYLSVIDRKISLNRAINANLKSLAKQIYDYWFVQFDFPDENGRPYKSTGGKMVWNEMLNREVPEGWQVITIGEFAEVRRGTTITKAQTKEGNVKVVAAAVDYSFLHNESNRTEYVITVSSSGANAGFINFWREPIYASDCSTIQCKTKEKTLFCYYWLIHFQEILFSQQIGAAQPHVYPEHINVLPIIVPPPSILEKVKVFFLQLNKKQFNCEKEAESLIKLRDELLPLLMNGQVTIE